MLIRRLKIFLQNILTTPHQQRVSHYKKTSPPNLLTNYPLKSTSKVVEVGGFTGVWSRDISARYGCYIHIFEPVPKYSLVLEDFFGNNSRVRIHPVGLSDVNEMTYFSLQHDATGRFQSGADKVEVKLLEAKSYFKKLGLDSIDLMNINIEGGEYSLLPHLIESGIIKQVKFLQVQFHDIVPNASSQRENILKKVIRTHVPTFSYPFVWEGFERIS